MAKDENKTIILLPIKPVYVEAIDSGLKKVEFRKKPINDSVTTIVIYSSNPVQMITGYFHVRSQTIGSPQDIWDRYKEIGGISEGGFFKYFQNAKSAVAIEFDDYTSLSTPLKLSFIDSSLKAPQNYRYLPKSIFNNLANFSIDSNREKTVNRKA